MTQAEYQKDLSLKSPILLDYGYKRPKVEKMLAILRRAGIIAEQPRALAVDIGCSGGFFTSVLAPHFERVIGLDIDQYALRKAESEKQHENLSYLAGDSLHLPFPDNSIDLIICNHVYEHVPDPVKMFADIHRVLKDDGVCYFGAASRLILMEPHYHLPFLSWLPKAVAHRYMRLFGKGDFYYENLRTYTGIRKLIRNFDVEDYTLQVLKDPDTYHARDMLPEQGILARIPQFIWQALYQVLPTYILILRRR